MKARGTATADEPVWAGRVHLGDEPGIHGDAQYSGLAFELPVTLTPFHASGKTADVRLALSAEGASSFGAPYLGHVVTVFALVPGGGSSPPVWSKLSVGEGRLTGDALEVRVNLADGQRYVTLRVEVDTAVPPGLYDDFLLRGLTLRSTTHFADLGFRL